MDALLRYVQPQGPLPDIKGSGELLVIGSAACVWRDLDRYERRHGVQDRMGINDIMPFYPGWLKYGATLHTENLPWWYYGQAVRMKKANIAHPPMQVHSTQPSPEVAHVWPIHRDGGTSGIFGAIVGFLMGYDRVILAGIPCDDQPRFYEPTWEYHRQFGTKSVLDEWYRLVEGVPWTRERIKSLSGRTRDIFGEP